MQAKLAVLFLFCVLITSRVSAIVAIETFISVEQNDSIEAIPLFRDVSTSATAIIPVVSISPARGTISLLSGHTIYWRNQRPATPSFRKIPVTWFLYKPQTGFTGTDSFEYHVTDGSGAASNTVKCLVKVRPKTAAGQTIMLYVNSSIEDPLAVEIGRLKGDMENEGYSVIVKSYPDPSSSMSIRNNLSGAKMAWDTIRAEYAKRNQLLTGVVLLGNIPPMPIAGIPSDDGFWNLSLFHNDYYLDSMYFHHGDTLLDGNDTLFTGGAAEFNQNGGSLRNVWVSRFYALDTSGREPSPYGDEITLLKRALDANHNYRTNASRLPHRVYYYDVLRTNRTFSVANFLPVWQDTVRVSNSSTAGRLVLSPGDTINKTLLPYTPGQGGEVADINAHMNTGFINPANMYAYVRTDTLMSRPLQHRFVFLHGCHTGLPGNIANSHIYTRGGGTVLAIGTSDYIHGTSAYSIGNSQPSSSRLVQYLAAGSNWGSSWLSSGMGLGFAFFYGDLSLKPKMAASNMIPAIDTLQRLTVSGNKIRLRAVVSDIDGIVAGYEWWFASSYNYGRSAPDTVTASPIIEIDADRVLDTVRLEIVDNFLARNFAILTGDIFISAEQNSNTPYLASDNGVILVNPNPFNPSTVITVCLPEDIASRNRVILQITDPAGKTVRAISAVPHANTVKWVWNGYDNNGRKAASGIYIVKLRAGSFGVSKTIVFSK